MAGATVFDAIAAKEIAVASTGLSVGSPSSGKILVDDGSAGFASVAMSGDATIAAGGAVTISAGAVENSMVLDSNGTGSLNIQKTATVLYDFSVDGGTAGVVALTGSPTIPDNAVVYCASYDVITTCQSSTDAATITLGLPTDGALFTAIAISDGSNPWDAGAFQVGIGAIAPTQLTPKKTTAARVPELTIAGGENVTAGKIVFYLHYYVTS